MHPFPITTDTSAKVVRIGGKNVADKGSITAADVNNFDNVSLILQKPERMSLIFLPPKVIVSINKLRLHRRFRQMQHSNWIDCALIFDSHEIGLR
jgi:hypothetical protein